MSFMCPNLALVVVLLLVSSLSMRTAMADNDDILHDTHKDCSKWAEMGECDNNPTYMHSNCASSCHRMDQQRLDDATELEPYDTFFDLTAMDIDGNVVNFQTLRDKVTIVTNVASYCGYTESHYRGLVELYGTLQGTPVEILAFPCNQFGAQEPESNDRIKEFATGKGVKFTMMDKINVNGPHASIVYKFLKAKAGPSNIGWNFATYYVISPDGNVESFSGVEPMDLKDDVLNLLNGQEL